MAREAQVPCYPIRDCFTVFCPIRDKDCLTSFGDWNCRHVAGEALVSSYHIRDCFTVCCPIRDCFTVWGPIRDCFTVCCPIRDCFAISDNWHCRIWPEISGTFLPNQRMFYRLPPNQRLLYNLKSDRQSENVLQFAAQSAIRECFTICCPIGNQRMFYNLLPNRQSENVLQFADQQWVFNNMLPILCPIRDCFTICCPIRYCFYNLLPNQRLVYICSPIRDCIAINCPIRLFLN